jgi:1,4-dihydroxy-6-naphthoate synthase
VSTQQSEPVIPAAPIDISIAHSPDSDDAFMFYGLATGKVRVPGYRFTHTLCDIETLNKRAQDEAFFDVTAISFAAYPYLQDKYTIMGCGGSVGEGYGPMVVSSKKIALEDLGKIKVAVPGTMTTAYLALKIFNPAIETVAVPFDQIIPQVLAGKFDAGLIIHEGQLTYSTSGLHKVLVARAHRPGTAPGRKRREAFAGREVAQNRHQSRPRQHSAWTGTPRTGSGIRHAVCPRPGLTAGQPLCQHVRE